MDFNSAFNDSYIGLRLDLLKYVNGENLNILDVGCATGVNGNWLRNNKKINYLAGIELDNQMGSNAKPIYDKIIIGNIESIDLLNEFQTIKFDYIILGDILEHLINPWLVLKKLSCLIRQEGKIIISIPNIQHINTFYNLYIKGEWVYNDRGIYDKTHLRWFTLKNIKNMIFDSNLIIDRIERKYRYKDAKGSKFPFGTKLILTNCFKNLFTFQYIVVCSIISKLE